MTRIRMSAALLRGSFTWLSYRALLRGSLTGFFLQGSFTWLFYRVLFTGLFYRALLQGSLGAPARAIDGACAEDAARQLRALPRHHRYFRYFLSLVW